MKHKKIKIIAAILVVVLLIISVFCLFGNNGSGELKTIKSAKQLKKIYEGEDISDLEGILINTLAMPFSFLADTWDNHRYYNYITNDSISINQATSADSIISNLETSTKGDTSSTVPSTGKGDSKDYSTTNIQVENVDEADIVKTDGEYIYYITQNTAYIIKADNLEIVSSTYIYGDKEQFSPQELYINKDKLIVIGTYNTYQENENTVKKRYSYFLNQEYNH